MRNAPNHFLVSCTPNLSFYFHLRSSSSSHSNFTKLATFFSNCFKTFSPRISESRQMSNAAGGSADQSYIYGEELTYEAVERALIARWLTMDWDIHSLLLELGVHLRISTDRCLEIHTKLKHELEVQVRDARPQIPAPAQLEYTLGRQRNVFTEHELGEKEKSAYEAVERAFIRLRRDPKTLRLLSKLRDVLRIPEEFYDQVLMRLERRVKTRTPRPREADDDEPPQPQLALGNSSNADDDEDDPSYVSEKYRCLIELSYGSVEEWERHKLTLLQPVDRRCYKDDEDDDDGNSLDKSDEEWKPDGDE